jgi:hypothetical protein
MLFVEKVKIKIFVNFFGRKTIQAQENLKLYGTCNCRIFSKISSIEKERLSIEF